MTARACLMCARPVARGRGLWCARHWIVKRVDAQRAKHAARDAYLEALLAIARQVDAQRAAAARVGAA